LLSHPPPSRTPEGAGALLQQLNFSLLPSEETDSVEVLAEVFNLVGVQGLERQAAGAAIGAQHSHRRFDRRQPTVPVQDSDHLHGQFLELSGSIHVVVLKGLHDADIQTSRKVVRERPP